MAYITNYEYYANNGSTPENLNWGSYQYVSMNDIVKNFELMYVGNDKLINNVDRYAIIFHAKRCIQELTYDALRSIKVLELTIDESLKMILPPDYVNYARMSLEMNGVLMPMIENKQVNFANSYLQDNNLNIMFDVNGNVIEVQSQLDISRLAGDTQRIYIGDGIQNGNYGWCVDGDWYFTREIGGRYGMDPETANSNTAFRIDSKSGVINFSSDISGLNVVLEYISDGMENGDDALISVNKLAEKAVYAYLEWAILDAKFAIQEYVVKRKEKQWIAARNNAKIRLTNINPSRMLMVLRGHSKWLK